MFYYARDDVEPFWAVTRYDDVMTVANHPDVFINGGPRLRRPARDVRRCHRPARRPARRRFAADLGGGDGQRRKERATWTDHDVELATHVSGSPRARRGRRPCRPMLFITRSISTATLAI